MDLITLLNFWLEKHLLPTNDLFIMVNLIYQINRQEKLHYIISKQTYIISKIEGVINFISFTALQIYRFYYFL